MSQTVKKTDNFPERTSNFRKERRTNLKVRNFDRFKITKHSTLLPKAFTENGL